ncbi:probable S-adenosylmethionine-dependent methyltransferase At5g37970 [Morus notabilis]|uniref:probable S-adenosylmethionine-dependent methyltransferase At5g37970 n=1 Tax=Morus notabilis TaxID=981085 RepID=UPI000CED58DB|nr:probable S-adenosylmethionine-dependent methyltransferase At5g37970 [Morus notabilis]
MSNNTAITPESYPMKGGDSTYSYAKNSSFQKSATNIAKSMIDEAITDYLDIKDFSSASLNNKFHIADLGCSVGPNTFISMQNILEAVQQKYQSQLGDQYPHKFPDFQIFFNDHVSNDFNTLFSSLPPERQYFAVGVPGSFHGRLFPNSSLHFVQSSYAVHWLSNLPEELLDKNSPAWNGGRIHYINADDEVGKAYVAQFAKDMASFLDARAKEIMVGGMMVLIMPSTPNDVPHSRIPSGVMFDLLGSSLMDMAKEELISEAQVDSFNLPLYAASPKEMTELINQNGFFSIVRMELNNLFSCIDSQTTGKSCTMHLRAALEGIIVKHFGSKVIDEVFHRLYEKTQEFSERLESSYKEGTQLVLVLKRKLK